MKVKAYTGVNLWLILLIWGGVFSSCVPDKEPDSPRPSRLSKMEFHVYTTRATDAGDSADRQINSLRVLAYDSWSGYLAYNIPFSEIPTTDNPAQIEILSGTYDFVFIANEDSDPAVKEKLTATDNTGINPLVNLRALTFDRAAFDPDRAIPMVTLIERVEVSVDNTIRTPDMSAPVTGVWSVPLVRVAIRLKMTLTMTESLFERWAEPTSILIGRIADAAYLLPGIDNSVTQSVVAESFATVPLGDSGPGVISPVDQDGNVTVTYDRLILPELFLSTADNTADHAMTLSMNFGDTVKTVRIGPPEGHTLGHALPRNTLLDMQVNVTEYRLTVDAALFAWNDAPQDNSFDGQHSFDVEPTEYFFNAEGGSQPIEVVTDYPDGWTAQASGITWGTLPTMADPEITLPEYTGTVPRTGTFTIAVGNLRKTIRVTQFPQVPVVVDAPPTGTYIGAFWRADQTGERLIRIAGLTDTDNGDWTAFVAEGREWIHLDTRMSTDPNIGWRTDVTPVEAQVKNGNDPGFDDTYVVNGNLKEVTGTVSSTNTQIYFRIGLNSHYTPTEAAPARYGVVLLSHTDNTKMQRIWIRQGEDADYVMRPEDPSTGNYTSDTRPAAVKFSPYNVTAPAGMMNKALGPHGGVFTDYPTQAGAMFGWGGTEAWAPVGTATGFDIPTNYNGYWDTFSALAETCSPGYHRPNDGPTDADTKGEDLSISEVRQSLWPMLPTGITNIAVSNSVSGFYADGYFDRRKIASNTTVSGSDPYNIAYQGRLFYNPTTQASLFLPYVARRSSASAASDTGTKLMSWTSSRPSGTSNLGWFMTVGTTYAYMNDVSFNCNTIRCVKDRE